MQTLHCVINPIIIAVHLSECKFYQRLMRVTFYSESSARRLTKWEICKTSHKMRSFVLRARQL